jgi:DNA mismatch repair protein MutL
MRIRQLPRDVITKIAAGEVIERPASVVKELLENSVDAGATRIDLEVEQGGIERICVADNGSGILAEDLPLAFASHATSKLANADDLFRIASLGFRGEALASIGAVAQVTLQSRAQGQETGAEITCHGGTLSPARNWNGAPGTRLEVLHLFYNTPVRRKFMRTPATELGHISEIFTRMALAPPRLHLTLRHNGKQVYEVPGSAELEDRITLFFGAEVRDGLYAVEEGDGSIRIRGFVADPSCERGNAKLQYLFINGRWIRDRSLGHAIQESYRGLLMTGRYAVVFLFIDLPADQVDVNVHPTKAEVRFRQSSAVYQLVFRAIRERLRQANLTPRLRVPAYAGEAFSTGPMTPTPFRFEQPASSFRREPPPLPPLPGQAAWPARTAPNIVGDVSRPVDQGTEAPEQPSQTPGSAPASADQPPSAPPVRAIQLYDSYLVLETPEGMLVIDQHALHERILFEQLKRRIREGALETQRLLIPDMVDLAADQCARAMEHRADLLQLGLEIDHFGGGTLVLHSYPAILGNRAPAAVLRAVVDHLISKDRLPDREQLLNDLLSLMACHAAVRAGDRLTPEEISALIALKDLAADTHHCPHGRPTSLLLSRQELDRQFRRI